MKKVSISYLLCNFLLIVICLSGLISCAGSSSTPAPAQTAATFTSFGINSTVVTPTDTNITLNVPFGTNPANLVAEFQTSESGAAVSANGRAQVSGVTSNNFSSPVVYTVTSTSGATINYTVTVIVAGSSDKSISAYSLNGISGVITDRNISVSVPYGTNLESLAATFVTNVQRVAVSGTPQISGVTKLNFTNSANSPLEYWVYAADGSIATYFVTVTVLPNTATTMTKYSLLSAGKQISGVIIGNNITVSLPFGAPTSSLIATFETQGTSVTYNSVPQISGTTANDFSNSATTPLQYVVTAADGVTKATYYVTVVTAAANANTMLTYSVSVPNSTTVVPGIISGTNITVSVPYGTSLTNLVATWTNTASGGESVTVGGTVQVNGVTANDFTNSSTTPLQYRVVAADGVTTTTYNVTITAASLISNDMTAFSINGVAGVISGNNISVTLPSSTASVTNLVASYSITGVSVEVNGTAQLSNVTANDFSYPVAYVVSSVARTTQTYYVTVTVVQAQTAAISSYSLAGVAGTINESAGTITMTVPNGTSLSGIVASFNSSGNVTVGSVPQTSGLTPNNLTAGVPFVYTVTSLDGTITKNYSVTVTVAPSNAKAITAFSINGFAGTIGASTITINVPYGTALTTIRPIFLTTGKTIRVYSNGSTVNAISGQTPVNLSSPTIYTVTAGDGTTQNYTVTVTAPFLFGSYNPNNISINPSGTVVYVTGGSGPSGVFSFSVSGTESSLLNGFTTAVTQSNTNLAAPYKIAFNAAEDLAVITNIGARRISRCTVSANKKTFSCPSGYNTWTNIVYGYEYRGIASQPPSYAFTYVASSLNSFIPVCPTTNVHDSADGGCYGYYNRVTASTGNLTFTPSGQYLIVSASSGTSIGVCNTGTTAGGFPQTSASVNPGCPRYSSPLFNAPIDIAVSYPNGSNAAGFIFVANAADNNIIACNISTTGVVSNCVNSSANINGWPSPVGYTGIVANPSGSRVFFLGNNDVLGTCKVSGKVLSNCNTAGTNP